MKFAVAGLVTLGLIAAVAVSVLVALFKIEAPSERVVVEEMPEVEIAVASKDLSSPWVLDATSVRLERVPRDQVPEGAITGKKRVIGRILVTPMVEGQVFRDRNFVRESSGLGLAVKIPEGMRAMAVTLSESAAMDGILYPGSAVDVLASFQATGLEEDAGSGRETMSTLLIEGVQVLGVHHQTIVSGNEEREGAGRGSGTRRQMVTLLVDGKQAEALQLASAHGSISLALRNPLDDTKLVDRGTLFSDLSRFYSDRRAAMRQSAPEPQPEIEAEPQVVAVANEPEPPVIVKPEPARWPITVTRGMSEQRVEFAVDAN